MVIIDGLAVFPEGDDKKPAILFVHGFPFDHFMWDAQIAELKQNYYCIGYDLRGLGKSEVGNGQFTIEMFVDDIISILNTLHVKKAVICGLSMGGYIALRAIEREPERFNGLILLDTKADADDNANKIRRAAAVKHILTNGSAGYVKAFVPNTMPDSSVKKLGTGYTGMIERLILASPVGIAGCQLAMAARTDTNDLLLNISMPTLVMCGEYDSLSPVFHMRAMAGKIRNAEFVVIKDAGHMTPLEQPEMVSSIISTFLNGLFLSK
ncbi:MAG: alpha/beta fold hydrolase [Ignavibacteriales bacterium]|nr:alpha/beta fold hydrolase [Ignavibacteriales bacterium]